MTDHISLPSQEKVRILRAQIRELEMADDAGDVGSIRRRRRPKVVEAQRPLMGLGLMRPAMSSEADTAASVRRGSIGTHASGETEVTASSPRIDSHPMDAPRQQQRSASISGEQQQSVRSHPDDSERARQLLGSSTAHAAPVERSTRPPEPLYYVGEVFRHKIYRYTGVIYGYDLSK